jgi:hypothetical protein
MTDPKPSVYPYRDLPTLEVPRRLPVLHALVIGTILGFGSGVLTANLSTVVGVMVDLVVLGAVAMGIWVSR